MLAAVIMVRLQKSYQNVDVTLRSLRVVVWEAGIWGDIWRWIVGEPSNFKPSSKVGVDLFFKPGDCEDSDMSAPLGSWSASLFILPEGCSVQECAYSALLTGASV